jgi:hypothetical protein
VGVTFTSAGSMSDREFASYLLFKDIEELFSALARRVLDGATVPEAARMLGLGDARAVCRSWEAVRAFASRDVVGRMESHGWAWGGAFAGDPEGRFTKPNHLALSWAAARELCTIADRGDELRGGRLTRKRT